MADSRLRQLSNAGVSVWIDSLSREMLHSGELARLMADDAIVGVTSNPTIFQKALAGGDLYDAQLREVARGEDLAELVVVGVALGDRLLEDRRVRRDADNGVVPDERGELAGVEHLA